MSSDPDTDPNGRPARADQFRCTAAVLEATPDAAVVSNLGVASYVLAGVEDRDRNCYLWGSMGVTTPVGLGIALESDEQVTVLDGDGSTLLSLGALATVARHDPPNLVVVVFDNAEFATTGGQPSGSELVDFAAVAEGVGLRAFEADSDESFLDAYADALEHDGAALVACRVEPVDPESRPTLDFPHIARRFRESLDGT
jgi:thiamine pyrophosphate-dependent acetolactate synthase large subunit-like protein